MTHHAQFLGGAAACALLVFHVGQAHATDAAAFSVEEIIVTAQKRAQNLQDVPIVVTAVGAERLQDAGVRDIKDLQVLVPGLQVVSTSSEASTTVRLRNIGTAGENPGLEASVGLEIDGVYRPRAGVGFGDLGEVERIEVLKGPQGTLFGKNTSAGVVRVLTRPPEFAFGVDGELTAGAYGEIGGSASVTGPLLDDRLAGRLFVVRRERDGFYKVQTGAGPREAGRDQTQDYYSLRGQLLFTPATDLSARLIADFTRRDELCCAAVQTTTGPTGALVDALAADGGLSRTPDPFARTAWANRETRQRIEDKGLALTIDWAASPAIAVTSVSAVRAWRSVNGEDSDFTSADIWYRNADDLNRTGFEQFSQELRFSGQAGPLEWLVGGFYAQERLSRNSTQYYGAAYEPYLGMMLSGGARPDFVSILTGLPAGTNYAGLNTASAYRQKTRSSAVFTNQTLRVSETVSLDLGLRYTREEKSLESRYRNGSSPACAAALGRQAAIGSIVGADSLPTVIGALCLPWADASFDGVTTRQKRSEHEWTGQAKITYRPSSQLMVYAGYARGYKAGGFNLDRERIAIGEPDPDTSFAPEFADAYEIGAKSTLLDGRLLLNGALFDERFEGYQYNLFTGLTFLVTGIPEVRSRGADLDMNWRTPLEGLTVQGGMTYAETQYGDFTAPPGLSPSIPGTQIPNAPRWSGMLGGAYEHALDAGLRMRASVNLRHTSRYPMSSADPSRTQDALTLVNARLAMTPEDQDWALELWALNLTNADYYQAQFDAPLQTGTTNAFLGAPRTWGLTLRVRR